MDYVVSAEQLAAIAAKASGETGLRFEDGEWIFVQYGDVVPIEELVRCRDCGNKKTMIAGTYCTRNMSLKFDPNGHCHLAEREIP